MSTFNLPLPSDVADNPFFFTRDISQQVVDSIKTAWGNKGYLPAGGFDALVRLPKMDSTTRDDLFDPIVRYVTRALWHAGVLRQPPSLLGVRFISGEAPGVEVTMAQLFWPDGRPAELPQENLACAAS